MKLTGKRNQCGNCRQYFNSLKAFDKHRTGKFGIDRRCLSSEEMQDKGMLINADGFWVTESMQWRFANENQATEDDAETVER